MQAHCDSFPASETGDGISHRDDVFSSSLDLSEASVFVSSPLFSLEEEAWQVSHVEYDLLAQRIICHGAPRSDPTATLSGVARKENSAWTGKSPDQPGLIVFEQGLPGEAVESFFLPLPNAQSVRFAPDTSVFAFATSSCPPNSPNARDHRSTALGNADDSPRSFVLGYDTELHIRDIDASYSPVVVATRTTNSQILDFFWLKASQAETGELVISSTSGIDIFKFEYQTRCVKASRRFGASASLAWSHALAGISVLALGPRTLQPYILHCANPSKLQRFDVCLARGGAIRRDDVQLAQLYEWNFCIHIDSKSGRIAIRSLTGPSPADIVLNVPSTGPLSCSISDDLLILHLRASGQSLTFDLKQGRSLTPLCAPERLKISRRNSPENLTPEDRNIVSQHYDSAWHFVPPDIIVFRGSLCGFVQREQSCDSSDEHKIYPTEVYRLCINSESIARTCYGADLGGTIQFYLRRLDCTHRITECVRHAMRQKVPVEELEVIFGVLNDAYRSALIHKIPLRRDSSRRATISVDVLRAYIGRHSLVTEREMVEWVFLPHTQLTDSKSSPGMGCDSPSKDDKDYKPVPPFTLAPMGASLGTPELAHARQDNASSNVTGTYLARGAGYNPPPCDRLPYIIVVVRSYLQSLLMRSILPHRLLQALIFELCVQHSQLTLLQQLLQYHLLLDSVDLAHRLFRLWCFTEAPWSVQACLDMALRLKLWKLIVTILVRKKAYHEVVPFLYQHRISCYPVKEFLQKIAVDVSALEADPGLLSHVLEALRLWRREAIATRERIPPPNLQECGAWLLEIRGDDDDVGLPR